ncbi:hypothetical protein [Actinoplanes aureus]|uniref:Uncharacterized protein n=1 Tax=Actinoplanes aureus TaxID=2792083 RepID=A0A931CH96_9ACTN|nr:hypothetical protein [Actinoplanes aureus]MBG0566118.1 hypothetical protein [Actinoplanes aureus]
MVGTRDARPPDFVPVLSRGKHRHPRRGACFMEFASYLAGERWTDHPACTHPLLAHLARLVNDYTSDAERRRLIGLIPSVVGLTSDDARVDLKIALRAATTALPVVAEERQRTMAVTVLTANRLLAELDGRAPGHLEDASAHALRQAPLAARWAREYTATVPVSLRAFRERGARAAVLYAVDGISTACTGNPDQLLRELLAAAIDDCAAHVRAATSPQPHVTAGR